jgi:hypothetical protein
VALRDRRVCSLMLDTYVRVVFSDEVMKARRTLSSPSE